MNIDSPLPSDGTALSVGLGVLLVLSAFGGVPQAGVWSSASDVWSSPDADASAVSAGDGLPSVQAGENNTTNVTIPLVRAMETAQNETNGKSVGAELKQKGNVTNLERPTRVFEVDVLAPNGTHFLVDINATDGSVRQVQTTDNQTGFFEGLFEDENQVLSGNVNVSEIRSGSEAVRLVQNETDRNRSATTVELTSQNGTLVYEVELVTEEGARSTVSVAAHPAEGGVLSNETTEGSEAQVW